MDLTGHTIDNVKTHGCGVLASQNSQISEIHVLENHFPVVEQGNVGSLLPVESRSRRNHFLSLLQIEVPYLHDLFIQLFPAHNPPFLHSIEIEILRVGVTLSKLIPQRLVSYVNND